MMKKTLYLQRIQSWSNEERLTQELYKFFEDLGVWIGNRLIAYYNPYMVMGQVNLITDPILGKHEEYYRILEEYVRLQYSIGVEEANTLIGLMDEGYSFKAKANLWSYLPDAVSDLIDNLFVASKRTLERVTNDINGLISDGYVNGEGVDEVSRSLTRRFDQLKTWEARRIARTETHNAHNLAVHNTYQEYGVEYTQWITIGDEKVRGRRKGDQADHYQLDGEIIPVGGTYSNGLRYPGDTSGALVEYINCRCAQAPFAMPYGMIPPPGKNQFFENELIQVGDDPYKNKRKEEF